MRKKGLQLFAIAGMAALMSCSKTTEIKISEFENEAAKFVDKEVVIVDAKVDHVCAHSAKKMTLIDANGEKTVTCMAGAELGSYSDTLNNKNVKVVAIVKEQKLDEEYFNKWEKALRDELAELMDTTKKQKEHKHDEADATHHHTNFDDTLKIQKYREEIKTNGKGYISKYYLEAKKVEVLK